MLDKRTIHVLTEYSGLNKIESYWRECFKDEDFSEFDVNIIEGHPASHDSYLWSDTYYKSTQLKQLLDMMQKHDIKKGDVFVFTNAWNYVAVPLSFFRHEFGLDIRLIGFWGNSLFNQQSPMWKRFKNRYKGWGRDFELALFNAYDMNCFLCEEHWKLFHRKYQYIKGAYKTHVSISGYPFGFLSRQVLGETKKSKIIVFPYDINDDIQVTLFKGLASELTDYEFVYAQKEHNHRWKYKLLLKEAMGLFCGKNEEHDPVMLYEGMLNGVIPMVPSRLMYYYFFPEIYQYPTELSAPKHNKMLYVVRNRMQLQDFICERIDNYDKYYERLKSDAKEIGEKYYKNDIFKKELLNL